MFAARLIRKNFRRDIMSEKKTVYSRRAHSVCCLTYHAVFVVKYRRKVISPGIMDFFKVHAKYLIEERFRGNLIEFNGEADHVHILFELPPSAAPSMVVCSLKTQLSREERKRYPEQIRGKLWNDFSGVIVIFWQRLEGLILKPWKDISRHRGPKNHAV